MCCSIGHAADVQGKCEWYFITPKERLSWFNWMLYLFFIRQIKYPGLYTILSEISFVDEYK